MGADAIPVAVVTSLFGVVGLILPIVLARGPNKGVIMVDLAITAATGWLFWLLAYMHQMNPLIGPQLHNTSVLALQYLWDNNLELGNHTHATHAMLQDHASTTTLATTNATA